MILDTSAILAVLFKEPAHEELIEKLLAPGRKGVGTPTLAEAGLVLTGRLEGDAESLLSGFLQQFEVVPVPFGERHWRAAVEAFRRFGRRKFRSARSRAPELTRQLRPRNRRRSRLTRYVVQA